MNWHPFEERSQDKKRPPYLEEMGWHRSVRERRSIDAQGQPLPWYTYPAISFLEPRIKSDWSVFEYGSGYSTLWWARHVDRVVSCEHNRIWFDIVSKDVPRNVTYVNKAVENGYAQEIFEHREGFDVVIVDGEDRVRCGENAVKCLKPGGIIIWDNSELKKYRRLFTSYFQDLGFRHIDFEGMGPQLDRRWATTVLYKPYNCLGL